jgi:hypothetical protein
VVVASTATSAADVSTGLGDGWVRLSDGKAARRHVDDVDVKYLCCVRWK